MRLLSETATDIVANRCGAARCLPVFLQLRYNLVQDLYRIERCVCSRGDDVQRSIELLDKVLSEYDEHEAEGEGGGVGVAVDIGSGGGDSGGGGGGGGRGGGGRGEGGDGDGGGGGDCGSSTEPSIGLTPDDESPSLGIFYPASIPFHSTPSSTLQYPRTKWTRLKTIDSSDNVYHYLPANRLIHLSPSASGHLTFAWENKITDPNVRNEICMHTKGDLVRRETR